jgi:hypothetical protein
MKTTICFEFYGITKILMERKPYYCPEDEEISI